MKQTNGEHILGFDTATDTLAIALGRLQENAVHLIESRDTETPRAALSNLVPTLVELLESHGLDASAIGRVIAGRGPGSFTGVRIGVATAKGLAQGLGVPLHGVGTLDAVAWNCSSLRAEVGLTQPLIAVVGDAMRGEVYPAVFRCRDGAVARLAADTVMSPQEAVAFLAAHDEPMTLAGNALHKHRDVLEAGLRGLATLAPEECWRPTGSGLLAAYEFALGESTSDDAASSHVGDGNPGSLLPIYTRLSDAEESERSRAGVAGGPNEILPPSGVGGDPS